MKKQLLGLLALGTAVGAMAQATGTLYPESKSVYVPSYYSNVVEVTYDSEINAAKAVARVQCGAKSDTITIAEPSEYGLVVEVNRKLQELGVAYDSQFTLTVTGVEGANDLSATYLYRENLPAVTSNPEEGELTDPAATLEYTFGESLKVSEVTFRSGVRMNYINNTAAGTSGYVTSMKVKLEKDYWSTAINPSNLQVKLVGVTISYSGSVWTLPDYSFDYSYNVPSEVAKYDSYYPLNDEVTVWEAYGDGWGAVELIFDGEVEYENALARIVYTKSNTSISARVTGSEMWGDWSWLDNLYHVEIPLPAADLTEETLSSISITVSGIKSNNTTVNVPVIIYDNTTPAMKKVKNTNAGVNVQAIDDNPVNVYSIQGSIAIENASSSELNTLHKGIYIVNGKKIYVK